MNIDPIGGLDPFDDEFDLDWDNTPTEYNIGGFLLKIDGKLEPDEIVFITNVSILGVIWYDEAIKNGYPLSDSLKEKLEPIITSMRRSGLIKRMIE